MAERAKAPFFALASGEEGRRGKASPVVRGRMLSFFLLAFLFSWLVEIPLALQAQGIVDLGLPFAVHTLAGYGPMAAAIVLTARNDGRAGLGDIWGRMVRWRVPAVWWVVAFSPLLFTLLLGTALWLLQGRPLALGDLGEVNFLPDLGLAAIPFWVLTFGIGEEVGWRGYALPRLQRGRGPLRATVILWFFWALWHVPLFFYAYDAAVIPGMLAGILAGAIVFTWLYNHIKSILIAAVWHGMFNLTTACVPCSAGPGAAAVSMLVIVWAAVLVIFYYRRSSSGAG